MASHATLNNPGNHPPTLVLRPQSRSQQAGPPCHTPVSSGDNNSNSCAASNDIASAAAGDNEDGTASGSASRIQVAPAFGPVSGSESASGAASEPASSSMAVVSLRAPPPTFDALPNELLFQIMGYLDVDDLLATSRVSHHLRAVAVTPILHAYRLRHNRAALPPLLTSAHRPTLSELQARRIFLTHTSVVSRRLARSLVSIRLARRLAARPTAEMLVARAVLPAECVPSGGGGVAPALVARRRAVERERVKDGLRRWVGSVWRGEVSARSECVRRREEMFGIGRVWRMCRFWEAKERVR